MALPDDDDDPGDDVYKAPEVLATQPYYVEQRLRRAEAKLKAIEDYMRNLGKATGDWSVASPVLEIISGDY